MSVRRIDDQTIALEGLCPAEDAEPLLQLLLAHPAAALDWRCCEGAHTAIVQVLIEANPALIGPPKDGFLANFVAPALGRIVR
jgi:hypothetical protein